MRKEQDGFGQEMWAHFMGEDTCELVERDDGRIDLSGGPGAYFRDFADWTTHEKAGIRLAKGRTLDVGCGAGRVALHLQQKGCEVVAIDVSPLAVKVCKKRGVKDARIMSITQIGRKLGCFDTIVMYGNNFGLFAGEKRARWLLRRFHRITTPRARIIAESLDPYQTDDPDHLQYHKRNRARGRMGGQTRLRIRYKRCKSPWFDYLLVSRDEMRKLLEGTGWRVRRFIDSKGPTYIAVIEKAK